MPTPFEQLSETYAEIADLGHATAVLAWDQETNMPPKGAEERGRQLATLSTLIHQKFTAPELDELITGSEKGATGDTKTYLDNLKWHRARSMKIPASLVKEMALAESKSFQIWKKARQLSDFSIFAPQLKEHLKLVRQKADCLGWKDTPWDGLVDDFERGMTAAKITEFFKPLRDRTIALLARVRAAKQVDTKFLEQKWKLDAQREFGLRVARDIGYDLEAGRQDVAVHPFCTTFGAHDVRITTRYDEAALLDALGSTVHEVGHALYEQGFRKEDARTPLAEAASYGVHESQSRFWEIMVMQSRAFWKHYLPVARQYFPGQLTDVDTEAMYRAANRVVPSLIRTVSDEVTYNLHIIIRFEIEVPLLAGDLPIEEVPEQWNKKYKEYLGVDVPNDAQGCLQDVHWCHGSFGYFPSYTFGNIYSAMFLEKMQADMPGMWKEVEEGRFDGVLGWLRRNIHEVGSRQQPLDLVRGVTGKEPSADALCRHLETKYAEIYSL